MPCGITRARDLVGPFRKSVGSHETEFTQYLERYHVSGAVCVKHKAEVKLEFDSNRSGMLSI